jgi:hypothetical protein
MHYRLRQFISLDAIHLRFVDMQILSFIIFNIVDFNDDGGYRQTDEDNMPK